MDWFQLPSIPDAEGFAGSFAGTSGGALLVAGGANFPGKKPWEGGAKVWYDGVFALDAAEGAWHRVGTLPRPGGYGVSATLPDGLACIGGADGARHHADCFLLRYDAAASQLTRSSLPSLPQGLANAAGALVDQTLYVAGGLASPAATEATGTFYALDLRSQAPAWAALPTWPGRGRMLATAGAADGAFYLFGGAALRRGPDGTPQRDWLQDAYRYRPGEGWRRIADLPRVAVAAPSPAPRVAGQLLVLGGDDGSQAASAPTAHRGFPRTVLAYDPRRDAWSVAGEVPFSLVTTPAVTWGERIVVPGSKEIGRAHV